MDAFEQMAHDAGYRDDEARQVARQIEEAEQARMEQKACDDRMYEEMMLEEEQRMEAEQREQEHLNMMMGRINDECLRREKDGS